MLPLFRRQRRSPRELLWIWGPVRSDTVRGDLRLRRRRIGRPKCRRQPGLAPFRGQFAPATGWPRPLEYCPGCGSKSAAERRRQCQPYPPGDHLRADCALLAPPRWDPALSVPFADAVSLEPIPGPLLLRARRFGHCRFLSEPAPTKVRPAVRANSAPGPIGPAAPFLPSVLRRPPAPGSPPLRLLWLATHIALS